MNFDQWWNSSAADTFRAAHPDADGEQFRCIWDAAAACIPNVEVEKLTADAALIDWLQENFYSRENIDWLTGKVSKTTNMWVFFAPKGVQGDVREVIRAAMHGEGK